MPSSVNLSRFNRAFERLFNIKGGPTVVDIDPSVSLQVQLAIGLEERYLFGVESFGMAAIQAAVAGNKSAGEIRNPAGSGVIVVVEKIAAASSTAQTLLIAVASGNPADLASAAIGHTRADTRTRQTSSAIVSQDAPVADPGTGFTNISSMVVPVQPSIDLIIGSNQEIVLTPGVALRLICTTVNTQLTFTFFWRERPLETSELT